MTSKAPARAPAANTAGVRRNLFHHHLSRRPTGASTSSSSATQPRDGSKDEEAEIVARHSDGNFAVRIPSLPALDEDHLPDEAMSQERESKGHVKLYVIKAEASTELEATMLTQLYKDRTLQPGDSAGQCLPPKG